MAFQLPICIPTRERPVDSAAGGVTTLLPRGDLVRQCRGSSADASQLGFFRVKQESLQSYELGIKATLFDGTLQANAGAFYYNYKNKQLRSKILVPIFGGQHP